MSFHYTLLSLLLGSLRLQVSRSYSQYAYLDVKPMLYGNAHSLNQFASVLTVSLEVIC